MTYNDLRKGRTSLLGQAYLITTVTACRLPLFTELETGRHIVNVMREHDAAGDTSTLAYVVMPDHVHWLIELSAPVSLAAIMKRFKSVAAHRVNHCLGRSGAVWQPSFHDHAIRSDESLVNVARYVIMNPVRANLVRQVGDYPLWDTAWNVFEGSGAPHPCRSDFNPTPVRPPP